MPLRYLLAALSLALLPGVTLAAPAGCGEAGQWFSPPSSASGTAQPLSQEAILQRAAAAPVVLLGETHDRADDHAWQLQTLEAIYRLKPDLAVGFEMFPRRLQPVLDRWVAGRLDEAEFLKQVDWDNVWGHDPQLYLPLFRFARQHKLPMLALNVERGLVRRVRTAGWAAVPEAEREGVGQPAQALPLYRMELKATYDLHPAMKAMHGHTDEATQFARFMEAQLLWDRAMAEAIAGFRKSHPSTHVVGILGAGHVRNGYGVPHQLSHLNEKQTATLVTLPSDHDCTEITPGLAEAVYLIPPQPAAPLPPRLGVALQPVPEGVKIEQVMPGSLAEKMGLKDGDIILQAAGSKVASIQDVRHHVYQQPPGTWLPLLIQRGKDNLEVIVKFPAAAAPDQEKASGKDSATRPAH